MGEYILWICSQYPAIGLNFYWDIPEVESVDNKFGIPKTSITAPSFILQRSWEQSILCHSTFLPSEQNKYIVLEIKSS